MFPCKPFDCSGGLAAFRFFLTTTLLCRISTNHQNAHTWNARLKLPKVTVQYHYAGRVARMHDGRLPNIVMRGEMAGGKRKRGQPAKRLEHRVTEYCTAFGIDPKCWMTAAQDAPEWYRKVETGAEVFMSAWSTKRVNETNARHAKELFATLPFELP